MSDLMSVTDQSFQNDVLEAKVPVLVDFWAPWCGPCRMMGPILEEVSEELKGKVIIAKMNIDENPQTPAKYGISSIPTLLLYANGQLSATKVGGMSRTALLEWLKGLI